MIEFVLVMGLLATVMGLAAPSLARYFRSRSLTQEAERLLALTEIARSEAVSQGVPMVVWMDETGEQYGMEPDVGYPFRATAVREYTVHPDVTLTPEEGAAASDGIVDLLAFTPDGVLTPESIQTVLMEDRHGSELTLTQTTNQWAYEIQTDTTALR